MQITVLMDNHTLIDVYHLGEPGASYWIEGDGASFLLDTGYSTAFLQNAAAMGIDLTAARGIVLSHGHDDHTGGLPGLLALPFPRKPLLVAHPDALLPKWEADAAIGLPMDPKALEDKVQLQLTREPLWLTEHLVFLGQIPTLHDFEARRPLGDTLRQGQREPDLLADDSALCWVGREGLYLITGCSHAGICSIIDYARAVTGRQRVLGVLGGFHLQEVDQRARDTVAFLAGQDIPALYPCHCTSFAVRAELYRRCPVGEVGVGSVLHWDE